MHFKFEIANVLFVDGHVEGIQPEAWNQEVGHYLAYAY